jgi:hypothetical protein
VFQARVGELQIEGCDFLHIDEDGAIDELVVMVGRSPEPMPWPTR